MRTIASTMGAALLLLPSVGFADANLCNKTGRDIWASYGEQYLLSDNDRDNIVGWYHIKNGHCASPVVGDVCNWWADFWGNCPANVLYFADDAKGRQWGGWGANINNGTDTRFICTTNKAFDENPQFNWENPTCPSSRVWRFWGAWYYNYTADVTITFVK